MLFSIKPKKVVGVRRVRHGQLGQEARYLKMIKRNWPVFTCSQKSGQGELSIICTPF